MQIHVEIFSNCKPRITIFSKSKRNSTLDRLNAHACVRPLTIIPVCPTDEDVILCRIILAALGLPVDPDLPTHKALAKRMEEIRPPVQRIKRSLIFDAEVVPYNEGQREGGRRPGIEEFWWLHAAGAIAEDTFDG